MPDNGARQAQERVRDARTHGAPSLDLRGLGLTTLPRQIGRLTALRDLDLSGNRLITLPPEIGKLTGLQHLNLSGNELTTLPPEIGQLKALQSLAVAGSRLTNLPGEIGQLTALQSLILAGNRLTTMPPEIGKLRALQTLILSRNRLTALPAEMGGLHTLEDAAEARPRAGGLNVEKNPLPAPYPALIREGQPAATRNVLAWLRGQLDPATLIDEPLRGPKREAAHEPPPLPAPGVGLHFVLNQKGLIDLAPPEDLDREGNNLRRLRSLHPELQELARAVVAALREGNRPHSVLLAAAEAYQTLIDQPLEAIVSAQLYVRGVRLANAKAAADAAIASDDLPPLAPDAQEAAESLLAVHGPFILATREGNEAIAEEQRYRRRPDEERKFRAATRAFADALREHPEIIRPAAAAALSEAADAAGAGPNVARSGIVAGGAVRNVTIVLLAGASASALPVIGGLVAGTVGGFAGAAAGLFVGDAIRKSKPFEASRNLLTRHLDKLSDADAMRFVATLRRARDFCLSFEPELRRLARQGEWFAWINRSLDWIKARNRNDTPG
ncbi:leucine-rich repeat domain-containing protein [Elioraea sp.]|uniref:leucine-rich repeat domain-containing protein n=1 Tax=Elioraea sp. TaxID=2185103 RepID=UPI003F6FE153